MKNTLLLIFAALALMIGSFVWFVATWDRDAEKPISQSVPANPTIFVSNQRPADFPVKTAGTHPYQTHTGTILNPYGVS